jgi:F-type H+-transporting ATPase subunit b
MGTVNPMTVLLAAESGSPVSFQWLPFVTAILVFGIAFWILKAKVWPKIVQGLDDRQHKILEEIKSAEEAREQANAALAEYEASLTAARHEASEMIAKAKADAQSVADDLRRRNEADLAEMKQRAGHEIDAAKHAAVAQLHNEAATLAAAMASKILKRQINAADQQDLVEETLRELGRARQEQTV